MKTRIMARAGRATHALTPSETEPILLLTGSNEPSHLRRTPVPLFVSLNAFFDKSGRMMRKLPRALGPWALDSGGFTEIMKHGRWRSTPREYAALVRRLADEVGNLMWAAPQDWMCEPPALMRSGKTAHEHQRLTTENFIELRNIAPDLPIIPVVQGFWGSFVEGDTVQGERWAWSPLDAHPRGPGALYEDHLDMYDRMGVDLREYPLVGIGSVCRRAAEMPFFHFLRRQLEPLTSAGVRFHAFGFKTTSLGFTTGNDMLASADSLAWSYAGKNAPERLVPWHRNHAKCNNCLEALLLWRARILTQFPHLYSPLPPGLPLVVEQDEFGEPVMTPRFMALLNEYRLRTLDERELLAADDYPVKPFSTARGASTAAAVQAGLEAMPSGVYLPPLTQD